MDVWEAIEKRRTIRVYKDIVPESMIYRIIRAGSKAASGGNSQPWEFIFIKDHNIIDAIAQQKYQMSLKLQKAGEEAAMRQKNVYNNASVVAICHKKGGLNNVAAWMAAENMALAATAEGYGCVMSTLGGEYKEAVHKLLDVPDSHELATVMVLGVPGEVIPVKREVGTDRLDSSWMHVNRFGSKS
jgi:nitroreductase